MVDPKQLFIYTYNIFIYTTSAILNKHNLHYTYTCEECCAIWLCESLDYSDHSSHDVCLYEVFGIDSSFITVKHFIFAMTLFSRKFARAERRENKVLDNNSLCKDYGRKNGKSRN